MPENSDLPQEVEFFFEYDPGYRSIPSNGVWGGLTPRGDFRLDFFVEGVGIPERVTNVLEEGHLGKEVKRDPKRTLVRRMEVGVLMSREQAKSLAEFIDEKLKEFQEKVDKR